MIPGYHSTESLKELAEEVYLDTLSEIGAKKGKDLEHLAANLIRYFLLHFYDELDRSDWLDRSMADETRQEL